MIEIEPFGPDYASPGQTGCPRCGCCTARLCERGRQSVLGCYGLAVTEHVYGCPCSAAWTPGTHAWRADQIRIVRHATEYPLPPRVEVALRDIDYGIPVDRSVAAQLRVRGLVAQHDTGHVITAAGRTYLAARSDYRPRTPVEVLAVDEGAATAMVCVLCWRGQEPVTVLLRQLTEETGLTAAELPGAWLEADANCAAARADEVVLTRVSVAPPVMDGAGHGWAEGAGT